eukprot:1160622-Pelagomonas_calceolata.AAC.9
MVYVSSDVSEQWHMRSAMVYVSSGVSEQWCMWSAMVYLSSGVCGPPCGVCEQGLTKSVANGSKCNGTDG